ncbi:MAG: cysteine dioxygenase, partial [Xanthomonadales bacterium]|nr:cysteine dioxygenase [Xanthomonadales bacterium]
AGEGSAGSLLPPHEYHTIANPSDSEVAVSLHIYKGDMCRCAVFSPEGDNWYGRQWRDLGLD